MIRTLFDKRFWSTVWFLIRASFLVIKLRRKIYQETGYWPEAYISIDDDKLMQWEEGERGPKNK